MLGVSLLKAYPQAGDARQGTPRLLPCHPLQLRARLTLAKQRLGAQGSLEPPEALGSGVD